MTWTFDPADTIASQGSRNATMKATLLGLNGVGDPTTEKGGWFCGTGGLGSSDYVCLFTYVDSNGVTRHNQFSMDVSAANSGCVINGQIQSDYDPTNTDPNSRTAFPFTPYATSNAPRGSRYYSYSSNYASGESRIFRTTENPACFAVLHGSTSGWIVDMCFFPWVGALQPYVAPANSIDPDYPDYTGIYPDLYGYQMRVAGYPITNHAVNGGVEITYIPGGESTYTETTEIFNQIPIQTEGVHFGTFAEDILYYSPPGTGPFGKHTQNQTPRALYDGSSYYINLGGDSTQRGYLLKTGNVDPTSWLL